jgi:hypothetical protein
VPRRQALQILGNSQSIPTRKRLRAKRIVAPLGEPFQEMASQKPHVALPMRRSSAYPTLRTTDESGGVRRRADKDSLPISCEGGGAERRKLDRGPGLVPISGLGRTKSPCVRAFSLPAMSQPPTLLARELL